MSHQLNTLNHHLSTLAGTGVTALITSMATDMWQATRRAIDRVLRARERHPGPAALESAIPACTADPARPAQRNFREAVVRRQALSAETELPSPSSAAISTCKSEEGSGR